MSRNAFAECERDYNEAAATKEEHQACVEEDALEFFNLGYTAEAVRNLMPMDIVWDAQYANKVCAAFARLNK